MTDKRISELPLATSLATTDYFPAVQAGLTKRATFDLLPFVQSGTGALTTGTVQSQLRKFTFLSDWDTSGHFDTGRDALTGTIGLPPAIEQTHALDAADFPWTLRTGNTDVSDFNFAMGDFLSEGVRNTVLRLGYNAGTGGGARDAANGAHFLSFESKFRTSSVNYMEFHWEGINGAGTAFRPWSWQVNLASFFVDHSISVDKISYKNSASTYVPIVLTISATTASLAFETGAELYKDVNNVSWLNQLNAAGNGYVSMWKVNASNLVQQGANLATLTIAGDLQLSGGFRITMSSNNAMFIDTDSAQPINFRTATTQQLQIVHTASASRYLTITGSNGGNPTISTSAGNVAITPAVIVAATSGSAIGVSTSSTTALNLPAGATGVSSIRLAHGSAPSSPVDGDMWTTSSGLFVRINGSTVGPLT